jgi:hypothetical protein
MDELPLALPRPRGLFGPLLELIARRVRAEVESELANFNLRPRHVIAPTVLDVLGEPSQSALAESLRIDRTNLVGLLNELEARTSSSVAVPAKTAATSLRSPRSARRLDEIQDGLAEAESRVFASLDSEQQATAPGAGHHGRGCIARRTFRRQRRLGGCRAAEVHLPGRHYLRPVRGNAGELAVSTWQTRRPPHSPPRRWLTDGAVTLNQSDASESATRSGRESPR